MPISFIEMSTIPTTSSFRRLTSHVYQGIFLSAVTASAQDLVVCYQRDRCSSLGLVFDRVTIQACCDNVNGGEPGGIGHGSSYQQDGIEGCLICPVG